MKKNYLAIFLSLVIIFLSACSDNDYYLIEKRYYRIKKEAGRIYDNPLGSPPKELERVVGLFRDFSKKSPNNNLSLDAEFQIANLYAVKEEYNKARSQLKAIINKYPKTQSITTEAIFLTGNTYQAQDNWNAALGEYKKIIQQYPISIKGLQMPIYIANYYQLRHEPEKMISAYQEAVRHYKSLTSDKNDPRLNYLLFRLLVRCHVELKEWENALADYHAMLAEFMDKIIVTPAGKIRLSMDGVLIDMAFIYARELKQKDKAKEMLALLVKNYPRSIFRKSAERFLKELDK